MEPSDRTFPLDLIELAAFRCLGHAVGNLTIRQCDTEPHRFSVFSVWSGPPHSVNSIDFMSDYIGKTLDCKRSRSISKHCTYREQCQYMSFRWARSWFISFMTRPCVGGFPWGLFVLDRVCLRVDKQVKTRRRDLDLRREVIFNFITWLSNNPPKFIWRSLLLVPSSFSLPHNTIYTYTIVNTARNVHWASCCSGGYSVHVLELQIQQLSPNPDW